MGIENTLISFYQNLDKRNRMKVIFTLPQLRDHSFISVVNRSVHHEGNPSVSQSINNSVNESIFQSANKSFSPNSSLIKNASNIFSHVRMSSPNKDETKVPEFNPPLEKNVIRDKPIFTNLLGANHKTRIDARNSSSISSPQVNQIVIQNDRVNSRHESGIDSPEIIQRTPTPPISEFLAPNMGDKIGSKKTPTEPISDFSAPNMGDIVGSNKTPTQPISEFSASNMGDKVGSNKTPTQP